MNKLETWEKLKFNIMFVGDDWYDTPKWKEIENKFQEKKIKVVYFPYTKGTSSTLINNTLKNLRNN